MSILEIILVSYLGLVVLGAIIQVVIEVKKNRNSFSEWMIYIFLGFPLMIFYNIFLVPFLGIKNAFEISGNPKSKTFYINYNDNVEIALLGMGFKKVVNHISKDNIPYSGFKYTEELIPKIILAFDLENKSLLNCSVYDENVTTKVLVEKIKKLKEVDTFKMQEQDKKDE